MLTIVEHGPASIEKPPEAVRGPASRLPWAWDGLCIGIPFNDPTRDAARDLVVNAPPSQVVGLSWTRDGRGNPAALLTSAADNYIKYPDNPQHNRPSTALTVHARVRRNGTFESGGGVFCKRYNISTPYQSWGVYGSNSTTNALSAQIVTTSPSTADPVDYLDNTYVLDTTTWYSVFFRWSTGTAPRFDVLGERGQTLANTTYGATVGGTIRYAAGETLHLNASESEAQNGNFAYSQVMVWSRRLTDTELQALVADPFGWYSPKRETVILAGPFPVVYATTFRVYGYAMFATATERDALQAELQAWLDDHVAADVWASGYLVTTQAGTVEYALPAGFDTPDLMDEEETPGGPWPGLTWSFQVATKELRDSFGAVPGLGSVWSTGALTGSTFGEATD